MILGVLCVVNQGDELFGRRILPILQIADPHHGKFPARRASKGVETPDSLRTRPGRVKPQALPVAGFALWAGHRNVPDRREIVLTTGGWLGASGAIRTLPPRPFCRSRQVGRSPLSEDRGGSGTGTAAVSRGVLLFSDCFTVDWTLRLSSPAMATVNLTFTCFAILRYKSATSAARQRCLCVVVDTKTA